MNMQFEQEIRYRLLKILSLEGNLSQRDMAKRVGISLGKVNFCLSELAKRGMIKIVRFKSAKDKRPYSYFLTARGFQEKARLTVRFLKLKLDEYGELKRQIKQLATEIEDEISPVISKTEHLEVLNQIIES